MCKGTLDLRRQQTSHFGQGLTGIGPSDLRQISQRHATQLRQGMRNAGQLGAAWR